MNKEGRGETKKYEKTRTGKKQDFFPFCGRTAGWKHKRRATQVLVGQLSPNVSKVARVKTVELIEVLGLKERME